MSFLNLLCQLPEVPISKLVITLTFSIHPTLHKLVRTWHIVVQSIFHFPSSNNSCSSPIKLVSIYKSIDNFLDCFAVFGKGILRGWLMGFVGFNLGLFGRWARQVHLWLSVTTSISLLVAMLILSAVPICTLGILIIAVCTLIVCHRSICHKTTSQFHQTVLLSLDGLKVFN